MHVSIQYYEEAAGVIQTLFNSSKRCSQPVKPEERSLRILSPGMGGGGGTHDSI